MQASSLSAAITRSSPDANRAEDKARKAGEDFEAVLLNNALGGLERAFTHLPGENVSRSSQAYNGFAIEALSSGLAQAGGVGLGSLVTKALLKGESARRK
jgi:Rod binding domain-containing protein